MKKNFLLITMLISTLFFMAFISIKPQTPWPVPEKYLKMANPVKSDAASLATGKELYVQHCQSCHGKKGKGDGPKAAQLDTDCGNFTSPEFKKQVDGALYYKTYEGRKDMPSFKKKIPDQNDIWAVVNYMKSL
jgi:mono/diheme cytochrome c family protein